MVKKVKLELSGIYFYTLSKKGIDKQNGMVDNKDNQKKGRKIDGRKEKESI